MRLLPRIGLLGLVGCIAAETHAQPTIYVNGTTGNDAWSGLCEEWDGGTCGPKVTIQAGIDAAYNGDTVIVADGVYTGAGNKDLDFGGAAITVRTANGPDNCIIDCEGEGRGFYFHSGEGADSILEGITVRGGYPPSPNTDGAGILCHASSPTIRFCITTDNSTAGCGGGVACRSGSVATIVRCTIAGNWSLLGGGGIYCTSSSPAILDSIVACNMSNLGGGGILLNVASPTIAGCTVIHNTTVGGGWGGGILCRNGSSPVVTNSLVWDSWPDDIHGNAPADDQPVVMYCNLTRGWPGEGNIGVDPELVDELGPDLNPQTWEDNDYHLLPSSPCIGRGDAQTFGVDESDIDGEPRVMGGRVDMGADEYTGRPFVFGDLNCDGVRDAFDIDPFVLALVDSDGYASAYPECNVLNGDCNADDSVNLFDVDPFVELLTGGS